MPTYKISDIEGIGSVYAEKLKAVKVATVSALLKRGCTRKGRQELSEITGIDETLILKWVNMADLYRVKGVGSEYSELLEKAGVDTVKELRNRNAENLFKKMEEVNAEGRGKVRKLPSPKQVTAWIEAAKQIEPMVTY
ncbi:DUF4332 domain-containing protein [candidate division KSB1 bacterium]|nr:DUF4332 domain-containing protein [candidate division KSB1 bacterium]